MQYVAACCYRPAMDQSVARNASFGRNLWGILYHLDGPVYTALSPCCRLYCRRLLADTGGTSVACARVIRAGIDVKLRCMTPQWTGTPLHRHAPRHCTRHRAPHLACSPSLSDVQHAACLHVLIFICGHNPFFFLNFPEGSSFIY